MWTCVNCGETENEDSFNFCYVCGARRPTDGGGLPGGDEETPREGEQDQGFKLPNALTSLGQRLRRATAHGGDQVVSVRVSHEAQEAIELLMHAGRFDNEADAAGFLLEEGARAQADLLLLIRQKLSEIERLRAELKAIGRPGAGQ